MSKVSYFGFVYLVTVGNKDYVVKVNHLDEFVSLLHDKGAIVVTDFVKSKVFFDNVLQWYKTF